MEASIPRGPSSCLFNVFRVFSGKFCSASNPFQTLFVGWHFHWLDHESNLSGKDAFHKSAGCPTTRIFKHFEHVI